MGSDSGKGALPLPRNYSINLKAATVNPGDKHHGTDKFEQQAIFHRFYLALESRDVLFCGKVFISAFKSG